VTSALELWLANAGRYPLLTPAQEITLGTAVRAWLDHPDGPDAAPERVRRAGLRARERLIVCNLRLVVSSCRGWFARAAYVGLEREDVLQIGAIGLQRAAEKYDPARGYKFSTYATLWCTQGVRRVCTTGDLIRVPARSDKGSAQCAAAAEAARKVWSLDAELLDGDGGATLLDLIADTRADALQELEARELIDRARDWCSDEAAAIEIAAEHGARALVELTGRAARPQLERAQARLAAMARAAG